MKLGLGTAQFGMDYGVSNRIGQTPPDEVAAILERAAASGVEVLDTAPAYGNAEQVLGETGLAPRFRIVTKTPVMSGVEPALRADLVERTLHRSLAALGVDAVAALLVHSVADLWPDSGAAIAKRMTQLKEQGMIGAVGVSVYSRDDLLRSSGVLPPDLVQLPMSVYDQRMLSDGSIGALAGAGVEVHTRSAFLQGVLTMAPEEIPSHLASLREHHRRYLEALDSAGISPLQGALGYALGVPGPGAVIVGVNTLRQFEELLRVEPLEHPRFAEWALDDPGLLNPALWTRS